MIWPFSRKPRPQVRPPLNEQWRPGDMAECIRDSMFVAIGRGPRVGARAMVTSVFPGYHRDGAPGWGLVLIGFPEAWDARGFRKIVLNETGADRKVGTEIKRRDRIKA